MWVITWVGEGGGLAPIARAAHVRLLISVCEQEKCIRPKDIFALGGANTSANRAPFVVLCFCPLLIHLLQSPCLHLSVCRITCLELMFGRRVK